MDNLLNIFLTRRPSVPLHLSVLLILFVAKLIWKLSLPFLLIIAGIYLLCYAVILGVCRVIGKSPWVQSYHIPLAWLLSVMVFFGGLYHYDRAGWAWYKLTGFDTTLPEFFPDAAANFPNAEFVKRYPIFTVDPGDSAQLLLKEGDYVIEKTILVPRGGVLVIEPGTALRFAAGRSLISLRPLIARGTADKPILFTAKDSWRKWGVVGVVRAAGRPGSVEAEKSIFEYVTFEQGRQARVNNVDFFAGLSIIESAVEISRCRFRNMYGKDALNVRYGKSLIQDNVFENVYKDGIDQDGGEGIITRNRFINCGDEGIDLTENWHIRAFENEIYDSGGGRVAAEVNVEELISLNTLGYSPGK